MPYFLDIASEQFVHHRMTETHLANRGDETARKNASISRSVMYADICAIRSSGRFPPVSSSGSGETLFPGGAHEGTICARSHSRGRYVSAG